MEGLNNKDYFSRLPTELIEAILLDAWIKGPPSKRFLPIFRRVLYRRIFISSYDALHLLTRTARSHPEFMSEASILGLEVLSVYDEEVDADPELSTNDDFVTLLKSVTRVQTLELNGCKRLGQLAFYAESPLPCFATVKNLHLEFPNHLTIGKYDYFDPVEFIRRLSKYTELVSLHYATSPQTLPSYLGYREEPPDMSQLPLLDKLTTFTLGGSLCNIPTLSYLAPQLPSLTHITFDNSVENRSSDKIFEFLRYVPNPGLVTSLTLLFDDVTEVAALNMVDTINIFTNLRDLSLPNLPLDSVYSRLSSLPLRSLTFEYNPGLSTAAIGALLNGPNKITTLETLCLDNFYAQKGDPIPRHLKTWEISRDVAYRWGWLLADWTTLFSRKGLEELRALGESEGIAIGGGALHAAEVEPLWEKELEAYTQARVEWEEDSDNDSEYQFDHMGGWNEW